MTKRKTPQKWNPEWASAKADTPEARRQRKAAQRQRNKQQMEQIEQKIYPLTYEQLVSGIIDGTVGVYVIQPHINGDSK